MVGIYFGIFAACLAGGVVLLLILEQLGVTEVALKTSMAAISVTLFSTIGAAAYTSRAREYLTAANRVPAIYNGLSIAIVAPGGAGLAGISGALFLVGFDSLCLGLGIVAGLTVSVMLIAPFFKKFGAPTVPSYLGQRYDSTVLRLLAASIAVVPLLLVAIAEIKIAVMATQWLTPLGPGMAATAIMLVLAVTVVPGGMRSLAWSSAAQALAVLIAILLPAAIAAVMETNLPFGQLSHGPVMRALARVEATQNVPLPVAGLLTLELPPAGLQPIAGRFAAAFGSVGPVAFVVMTLCILAGVAGSPALLARAVTTPSVYETRKSIGWSVALLGILLTTFSSVAVFERDVLLTRLVDVPASALPVGIGRLVELGIVAIDAVPGKLTAASFQFDRDGMLVALPALMGMPVAVINLVAAGVLAAALAGAAASITQLGIVIGEDVINGPGAWRMSDLRRTSVSRIAIGAGAALAGIGAVMAGGDPLRLLLHAFAISGSALFPVLALSIWWKRTTAWGAMIGLLAGFVPALVGIVVADVTSLGLPGLLAPAVALPLAVAATVGVSHLTRSPDRHMLEMVRDLRIPGGETIHDREARQARHRTQRAI